MVKPLILLIGPSGSGKSTIAERLCDTYNLKQVFSYTSRSPRFEGEPGHLFCPREYLIELSKENKLVAWTEVEGNLYGATKEQVDDSDIYVIDSFGAKQLKNLYETKRQIFFVYLDVDYQESSQRMRERGDSKETIRKRMAFDTESRNKAKEVSECFDHSLFYKNVDIEATVNAIAKFAGVQKEED